MNCTRRQGFTLIELLVVIAIIGILSTIAVVALGGARAKSRDAKRVADIRQIGNALELYYNNNNSYPTIITPGQSLSDASTVYMKTIPSNPTPRIDGGCPNQDYQYYYITATNTYVVSSCTGTTQGSFIKGPVGYHTGMGLVNCGGYVADRDGNSYKTVQIGSQCWMAENLRTKTKRDGTCINTGGTPPACTSIGGERDCIADTSQGAEADCTNGYTLYTWAGAMNPDTLAGAQGICPDGWHVPTDPEWYTLESTLADRGAVCSASRDDGFGGSCTGAGGKMKLGGDANYSGLLAGARFNDGTYYDWGLYGYFWSSTTASVGEAYSRYLTDSDTTSGRVSKFKSISYSIRCIKN
ncbi:MAG TPA: FISUMP domain-containing protein [bacterium]|nr:FISUMP domain-containing protein [bacterium]